MMKREKQPIYQSLYHLGKMVPSQCVFYERSIYGDESFIDCHSKKCGGIDNNAAAVRVVNENIEEVDSNRIQWLTKSRRDAGAKKAAACHGLVPLTTNRAALAPSRPSR
ncbi:hypothetical protein ACP275_09G098000 [Erythranthe tilingii]